MRTLNQTLHSTRAQLILLCTIGCFGLFTSCNDVIDLDADFTEAELVIDAWISSEAQPQTIYLSLSQDYFEASLPPAVTNASITLSNDTQGLLFDFTHQSNGAYVWSPASMETIGVAGDEFTLTVTYNDQVYTAKSSLNAVPSIDSIVYEFEKEQLGNPEGYYAQFYARDLPGFGDTYWIKTYKNGQFLNKPSEMNLSYDGTFDAGSETDGIAFIPPIRFAVNRIPDPDTADDGEVPPYAIGDTIRVEIHAITNEAFRFLGIAQEQMTNGDNGIFALPVANSPSNISAVSAGAPDALGFFNVASVSVLEVVVEE